MDGSYFKTFGLGAAVGRVIDDADHRTAARVAVISHDLWRRRFAADQAIASRIIRIAAQTFEIVGVAPPKFLGPFARPLATYGLDPARR